MNTLDVCRQLQFLSPAKACRVANFLQLPATCQADTPHLRLLLLADWLAHLPEITTRYTVSRFDELKVAMLVQHVSKFVVANQPQQVFLADYRWIGITGCRYYCHVDSHESRESIQEPTTLVTCHLHRLEQEFFRKVSNHERVHSQATSSGTAAE